MSKTRIVDDSSHSDVHEAGPGGVTREEFETYERIRESGLTNMFDATMVEELSDEVLNRGKILAIMKNYRELCESYPGVREGT